MRAAGVDQPPQNGDHRRSVIIALLRITWHSYGRQVAQRLWRQVGAVGPNHCSTDRIDGDCREVVWVAEGLEHRPAKQRLDVNSAFITIIETQSEMKWCRHRDVFDMQNHVSSQSSGSIGSNGRWLIARSQFSSSSARRVEVHSSTSLPARRGRSPAITAPVEIFTTASRSP